MTATPNPPSLPTPPDVIAFDLMGTLVSLAALEPLVTAAGGDASTVGSWFARLLADGFAITAAGDYQPFSEVADSSLRQVLPKAKAAARKKVLKGLAALDPFPDAGPAMGRAAQDARVIVVANAGTDAITALLARDHLDTFVEEVVSAEATKVWKPGPDTYSFAAAAAGVPVQRLAMVTVHPWDVFGAAKAGLLTGWCNRNGTTFPAIFGKPDATGANLVAVVEGLLALKAPASPPPA